MPVATNRVLRVIKENDGFLRDIDLKLLAEQDRLRMILVRCGNGRFLAPAQDVKHFIDIIERDKSDYIRDISLPTSDPIWRE